MADEPVVEGEGSPKKKSGLVMLIIGVALLTVGGVGGGWVVGGMLAPSILASKAEQEKIVAAEHAAAGGEAEGGHGGDKKEAGLPRVATEANGTVLLEPLTTNLAYPSDSWIRLEVALVFNGAPDAPMAETIHQDIMAYLKTVSLQQIQGPRGFQYLKEDLQERVDVRSQGRVSKVLFRTFVIE